MNNMYPIYLMFMALNLLFVFLEQLDDVPLVKHQNFFAQTGQIQFNLWTVVLIGILAFIIGGILRYIREQENQGQSTSSLDQAIEVSHELDMTNHPADTSIEITRGDELLDDAEYEEAIVYFYSETRGMLVEELNISDDVTPWEFYEICVSHENFQNIEELQTLTEAYENAEFNPQPVTNDIARKARNSANSIMENLKPTETK